jgi:hypothetical protein
VIKSGPDRFEAEWSLALGGSVRVVERLAPHAALVGPGPSADDVATTAGNRARWKQSKAPDGANALHATIGHVFISIEGPLSYDKLFDIARSLRPGFPSNLML